MAQIRSSSRFSVRVGRGVGTLGGSYGENPYIFYAPNTGEKFVRQMLTPLDIGTVALILQAGWSIEPAEIHANAVFP